MFATSPLLFFLEFLTICGGLILGFGLIQLGTFLMKRNHILYGPVFIPTKNIDLEMMIKLAEIKPGDKVADLGSGNGKVIIALAQRGIEAHGYENSPSLVLSSRWRIHKLGLTKKAHIHWQDFWNVDFSQYDVIMMYTSQFTMEKLEK